MILIFQCPAEKSERLGRLVSLARRSERDRALHHPHGELRGGADVSGQTRNSCFKLIGPDEFIHQSHALSLNGVELAGGIKNSFGLTRPHQFDQHRGRLIEVDHSDLRRGATEACGGVGHSQVTRRGHHQPTAHAEAPDRRNRGLGRVTKGEECCADMIAIGLPGISVACCSAHLLQVRSAGKRFAGGLDHNAQHTSISFGHGDSDGKTVPHHVGEGVSLGRSVNPDAGQIALLDVVNSFAHSGHHADATCELEERT